MLSLSRTLFFATLALAIATPAMAGTVFHWRTEDGGYAFSDSFQRVPHRYRAAVDTRSTHSLRNYDRFTPSHHVATERYTENLVARVERMRAFNAAEETSPVRTSSSTRIRTGGIGSPTLEFAGDDDAPIVVEKRRYRRNDSIMTRHITTVRQGDRLLAVIKPTRRGTTSLADAASEEDLDLER